ncbi:sodium/calcium exchanger regulatory protein 1-like isoform X2 [Pollicipes pollicipes]|uniref:sodium/calcium exchanger regulatory protein 1-like isoform X2 n=1 Tax=Pollicipes pollicipes TaxID=41117 RepID=UPI0018853958|nr:sodium/calcium exchanger regulatory protein 1-like isoform X2 [Pollicipes pollicipes]
MEPVKRCGAHLRAGGGPLASLKRPSSTKHRLLRHPAAKMVKYDGDYKLVSSENFDEYMKAVGVGMVTRKAANALTPVVTVTVNGQHWSMKQVSSFKTSEQEFDLGVERDITTPDGRKVKSIVTKNGDTLTEKQTGDGKESTLVREFSDEGIKAVVSCNGVVCTRVYKRQ